MAPAVAAAPIEDALKLSDNDKRIIIGVVNSKYTVLLGKLKAHRSQLERELDGKQLRRGEVSWIGAKAQELIAAKYSRAFNTYEERIREATAAAQQADKQVDAAQEAVYAAQRSYDSKRDKLLPVRIVNADGGQDRYTAYSTEPTERHFSPYRAFNPKKVQVTTVAQIKELADKLAKAAPVLAPLEAKLHDAQKALEKAEAAQTKAEAAVNRLLKRSGLDADIDDDDQTVRITLSFDTKMELRAKAKELAAARFTRVGQVIEQTTRQSSDFRQELALSRLDSDEAARIVAAIPESIDAVI